MPVRNAPLSEVVFPAISWARVPHQPAFDNAEFAQWRAALVPGGPGLVGKARGLMQMLFTPTEDAAPPEELERFQYEHPLLTRDPFEYFDRGQIFVTAEPDDPAPAYLEAAMGAAGTRSCCFAVDYGHWDATLKDCVGLVRDNPNMSPETARAVLGANALELYGKRLKEKMEW